MLNRRTVLRGIVAAGLSPLACARSTAAPRKVLLDTDIGSDIDDAVALAYLLRQPACELMGITTVTGDAQGRANLAASLCELAGKRVPIFPGAEQPLSIAQMQPEAPQTQRLPGSRRQFPEGRAVDFLAQTIRAHPGEITLLAVGPLTNVARLFDRDPEVARKLHSLVWMGGKYSDYPTPWGPTEWNAIVDPHAAARVLAAPVPAVTVFGLGITWQVSMTPAVVAERLSGDPLLERVLDWSKVWFEERELLHFHDPLAAVSIFAPGFASYRSGEIAVDLRPGEELGVTHFRATDPGRIRVATDVEKERFLAEYFSVFETAGAGRR